MVLVQPGPQYLCSWAKRKKPVRMNISWLLHSVFRMDSPLEWLSWPHAAQPPLKSWWSECILRQRGTDRTAFTVLQDLCPISLVSPFWMGMFLVRTLIYNETTCPFSTCTRIQVLRILFSSMQCTHTGWNTKAATDLVSVHNWLHSPKQAAAASQAPWGLRVLPPVLRLAGASERYPGLKPDGKRAV